MEPRELFIALLRKPGFLRDTIKELETIEDRLLLENPNPELCNPLSIAEPVEKLCVCRPLTVCRSSKSIFPGIEFSSQTTASHRQDCPYSRDQKLTRKVSINVFHISKLIEMVLQASFTVQFGAGGMSISPSLELRGFSRNDSPAFTLFKELEWYEARTVSHYLSILSQISTRLRFLFTNGEASPSETNEYGDTLLHVRLMYS